MSKSEKRQKTALLPSIRCHESEREQVKASAGAAGLSTGEFMLRCALGRKIVAKTDTHLKMELARLGGLQKHLYLQMQAGMTAELSKEFADTLVSIRVAIAALDLGIDLKGR